MSIKLLKIEHLRNINEAELEFSGHLNFIRGKNGSGKSTLLEAIYMIGRGRSYRTSRFGPVIQKGQKSLSVYSETKFTRDHKIGLLKSANQTMVRVDGKNITKLSEIARITPLQILTPMSHEILERGPEYRRRFIEWGVFHVEQSYFTVYRNYIQALRQRNAAIKTAPSKVAIWNRPLAEYGEKLSDLREGYFRKICLAFQQEIRRLAVLPDIEMSWRPGWDQSLKLEEAFVKNTSSDVQRGFTQTGPHRADMRIKFDARSAFTSASRGQQKMIIAALHLAQAQVTKGATGSYPVLLLDDLVSELDHENRSALLKRVTELGCQTFITSTDPIEFDDGPENKAITIEMGTIM